MRVHVGVIVHMAVPVDMRHRHFIAYRDHAGPVSGLGQARSDST